MSKVVKRKKIEKIHDELNIVDICYKFFWKDVLR